MEPLNVHTMEPLNVHTKGESEKVIMTSLLTANIIENYNIKGLLLLFIVSVVCHV